MGIARKNRLCGKSQSLRHGAIPAMSPHAHDAASMGAIERTDIAAYDYDAVAGYAYDEFAECTCDENLIGFDRETNLNYNLNRWYDPGTGRYTTFDPIGLRGGINGYAYVASSPLSKTDPRGLDNPGMGPYGPSWSNSGSGSGESCGCDQSPRMPDYGGISIPILGPVGVSVTVDRAWNVYVGVGVGAGLRGGAGGGVGWTGNRCKPNSDQLKSFLGGEGANAGVGLGANWSAPFDPGNGDPRRLGLTVQTPGVSYGYNWVVW